ncbi:hypothetical protein ABS768_07370 [Flavobacterium sp. ST-75]|uniref:Uncharacterized protein n=1 Tax=Flavobacterium rhizophilum TaxID=3163296 RepID=A0ABW8YBK3_9FLAO
MNSKLYIEMDFKTMLQLPAMPTTKIIEILQQIVEKERDSDNPDIPQVRITAGASGSYAGYFIDYNKDDRAILLGNWFDNQSELNYIDYGIVTGITVSRANKYAYLFSDGKIPFVPAEGDVPTMLKLKEAIKDTQAALKIALKVPHDVIIEWNKPEVPRDTDKYYAKEFLSTLKNAVACICADNLGREAFAESVKKLVYEFGTENKVILNGEEMLVTVNLERNWQTIPSAIMLQEMMEKCL